jgi:hypothetical protein
MTMTTEDTMAETAEYVPTDTERHLASDAFLLADQPRVDRVDITPWVAEQWLARNMHNRNVSPRYLSLYAHDLQAGKWIVNGDSFRFDVNGELIDGQHRLNVIVETGLTLPGQFVVRGLPVEARQYLDAGKSRTVADVLTIGGMDHAKASRVASVTKTIMEWEAGLINEAITRGDQVLFAEQYADCLIEAVEATRDADRTLKLPTGVLGALYFFVVHGPTEMADIAMFDQEHTLADHLTIHDFVEGLHTGAGLESDDPCLVFRNWYHQLMRGTNKPTVKVRHGALVAAWNSWAQGETIARLRVPRLTGRDPQSFPSLIIDAGAASAAMFGTTQVP